MGFAIGAVLLVLVALGIYLIPFIRHRDKLTPTNILILVVAVLAVLAVCAAAVVVGHRRARSEAGPLSGWGGLAAANINDLKATGGPAAPRGILAWLVFHDHVNGRLRVGNEIRFRPGPVGRVAHAKPFTILPENVDNVQLVGRYLSVHLEGGGTIEFAVLSRRGLAEAITRFA